MVGVAARAAGRRAATRSASYAHSPAGGTPAPAAATHRGQRGAGHEQVDAERHPAGPAAAGQRAHGVQRGRPGRHGRRRRTSAPAPRPRRARPARSTPSTPAAAAACGPTSDSTRPVGGHVARLDPEHEPHLLQERRAAPAPVPGSMSSQVVVAVLGEHRVVLDVPVRGEHQHLGALRRRAGRSRCWVVRLCSQLSRSAPGTARRPGRAVDQADRGRPAGAARAAGRRSARPPPRRPASGRIDWPSMPRRHRACDVDHVAPRSRSRRRRRRAPRGRCRPGSRARRASRSASGSSSSGSISSIAPQSRQTRWTCWSSPAAW